MNSSKREGKVLFSARSPLAPNTNMVVEEEAGAAMVGGGQGLAGNTARSGAARAGVYTHTRKSPE